MSSTPSSGESDSNGDDPLIGTTLDGKYKILKRIGTGGMGAVYQAEHSMMRRIVAIKVLRCDLSDEQEKTEYFKRFEREVYTTSKIEHPNAVTVHDYGIDNAMPYLVMKYVSGDTLRQVLAEHGPLSAKRTLNILEQTAGALAQAHSLGIVHRDLKPDNIMISQKDDDAEWVEVLDFGIAKVSDGQESQTTSVTKTGCLVGSPRYMSPEQVTGKDISASSDIYSLGTIAYEMLCGSTPFQSDSVMEFLTKHAYEAPPKMSATNPKIEVPASVEAAILRSLAKDPEKRQQSISEFIEELKSAFSNRTKDNSFKMGNTASEDNSWTLDSSGYRRTKEVYEEANPEAAFPNSKRSTAALWSALAAAVSISGFFAVRYASETDQPKYKAAEFDKPSSLSREKLLLELKDADISAKNSEAQIQNEAGNEKSTVKEQTKTDAEKSKEIEALPDPEKKSAIVKLNKAPAAKTSSEKQVKTAEKKKSEQSEAKPDLEKRSVMAKAEKPSLENTKSPSTEIESRELKDVDDTPLPPGKKSIEQVKSDGFPVAAGYQDKQVDMPAENTELEAKSAKTEQKTASASKRYRGTLELNNDADPVRSLSLNLDIAGKDISGSAEISGFENFRVRGKIYARGVEIEIQNSSYYLRLTGSKMGDSMRGAYSFPAKQTRGSWQVNLTSE